MAIRVRHSGVVGSGASGSGNDEEEGGEADDEDWAHRFCSGSVRSRADPMFKSLRSPEVILSVEAKVRAPNSVASGKSGVLVFVGNIPFRAWVRWLYVTFQRFGQISNAYISCKLSRGYRRRFGFVRFAVDSEADHAISILDGSLIGNWHLIVQRSKFNFPISLSNRSKGLALLSKNSPPSRESSEYRAFGGISHESGSSGARKRVAGLVKDPDWNQCAAHALLRSGMSFSEMRSIILDSCSFVRSISLIKDNSILIVFQSHNHRGLAIEHGLWSHWFYSMKEWDEGRVREGNHLWVECVGVPFCAWNDVTFEAIASIWGSIIEVDSETSEMVQLEYSRLCISTLENAIDDIIELEVGGNVVDVRVSSSCNQNISALRQVKCNMGKNMQLDQSDCEQIKRFENDMSNSFFKVQDNQKASAEHRRNHCISAIVASRMHSSGDLKARYGNPHESLPLLAKSEIISVSQEVIGSGSSVNSEAILAKSVSIAGLDLAPANSGDFGPVCSLSANIQVMHVEVKNSSVNCFDPLTSTGCVPKYGITGSGNGWDAQAEAIVNSVVDPLSFKPSNFCAELEEQSSC